MADRSKPPRGTAAALSRWVSTALFFIGMPAFAEVRVTYIASDSQILPNQPSTVAGEAKPVRISSGARSLKIEFTESDSNGKSSARLRYRLEGYDESWRDLNAQSGMRVSVQFTDVDQRIVGTEDFDSAGETPGWRGTAEESEFQPRSERFVAPARAVTARIVIYGHIEESGLGELGVDHCRLQVRNPKVGREELYDWTIVKGTDLDQALGVPANWDREGSRAGMAVLRTRNQSHPILVIHDDDPMRTGIWSTARKERIAVQAGDELTLSWEVAHSIGSSGPGKVEYSTLKPGRYWFRVAAANANGQRTGQEALVPIIVIAPLPQRIEFWLVVVALTGGAATWIPRVVTQRRMLARLAQIEREQALERERSRIARDLHDDVGAGLTEIAMQSNWVRRDLVKGANADTLRRVDRICQSAIELTRSVDEIVWAVNPSNDTLERFAGYLTQTTEQFLDAAGLRVRFHIPTQLPALVLTGKVRHGFFLAVREAINNAAKHAGADLIRLSIQSDEQVLRITVEDNGCGFAAVESGGLGVEDGLLNMRRRMEEIGGQCRCESELKRGTRVEFELPFERAK